MTVRVMVVDDDPDIRLLLQTYLLGSCCVVVAEAGDGEEALAKLAEAAPDIMIVDISMSGMDGVEFTRRAKQLMPRVVVFGLTADPRVESHASMLDAGACRVYEKDGFRDLVAALPCAGESAG